MSGVTNKARLITKNRLNLPSGHCSAKRHPFCIE